MHRVRSGASAEKKQILQQKVRAGAYPRRIKATKALEHREHKRKSLEHGA